MAKHSETPDEAKAGEEAQAKTAAEAARTETKAGEETQAKTAEEAKAEAEAKTGAKEEAAKTRPVLIRHKTHYLIYRCAGLLLTRKAQTCQVSETQLEILRRDPWVVIEKEPAPQ